MARVLLQLVSAPHRSPFETTPLLPPLLPTLIALPPSSSLAQVWALQVACARVVGGVDKDVEAEPSSASRQGRRRRAQGICFRPPAHFSHMSHPTFPTSHL